MDRLRQPLQRLAHPRNGQVQSGNRPGLFIYLSLFLFNICSICIDFNVPRNTFTCQITHSKHLFARLRHSSWINHCYIPFDAPTGPIHQHRAWLSSRWTSGTVTSSWTSSHFSTTKTNLVIFYIFSNSEFLFSQSALQHHSSSLSSGCDRRTMAVKLLADYASFGLILPIDAYS